MTVQTTRDTGAEACDVVAQQAASVSPSVPRVRYGGQRLQRQPL